MDAIKRASFASKQIRAGPAPLASFEDLPSDELESPEDIVETPIYKSSALEDESGSSDVQLTTPDSLTVSSQSTPRIESDLDSHFTLTPGDSYEGQASSELRTISLSSLSKESALNIKPKKGSAVSLGTIETSEPEYNQRKSSWTDIFRSHNQNTTKTTSVTSNLDSAPEKTLKKKSRSDLSKKDKNENKPKEKGKFLSIFKKKSNKSTASPVSPDDFIIPSETLNISEPEEDVSVKVTNGTVPKGKENELPNNIELCPTINEAQNDLGKINSDRTDKIPDERKINRKLINICEKSAEKEYNILSLPELKEVDKVSKTENIQAIVHNVDLESSESELGFEEKDESISEIEKKEDDYEAETLLTPDISEMEDDQLIELKPISYEVSKQVIIPSRQQRLEVTTKPIDRPRSTTPINTASLEAFICSVSPTFQTNVEKIKLSLPGEQFLGRMKSPKKSCAKSWSDFCERGLSPRMYKRTDKDEDESMFTPFEGANFSSEKVPFSDLDSNWAAFESDFKSPESNRFSDNFSCVQNLQLTTDTIEQTPQRLTDPYQPFETNFFSCSCDCHKLSFQSTEESGISSNTNSTVENCSCNCRSEKNCSEDFSSDFFSSDNINTCDVANASDTIVLK